jgi:tyrosinase
MSPVAAPTPSHVPVALRHRRDVRRLTDGQLTDFRASITQTQAITDDRGYQYFAGIHGLPLPISCTHNSPLFLAWHRAYLYFFEKALQDQVAGVTLPWWDWTTNQAQGLPLAYSQQRPQNRKNPLFSSPIQPAGRRDPKEAATWRQPGQDGQLPTPQEIDAVLANSDFFTFQTQLESYHGAVHVWVGGTMGDISVAAYDPVFWAHHCMIDRLWYIWQERHPGADPPANLLGRALPPFAMTVRDTLEISHLGYDYAAATAAAPGPGHHA